MEKKWNFVDFSGLTALFYLQMGWDMARDWLMDPWSVRAQRRLWIVIGPLTALLLALIASALCLTDNICPITNADLATWVFSKET